ncbi:hypothetical protein Patl1_10069 [Pistacia atlantica]|uniref:Uncharacterized protein n=1 Tax=Pistacia atlantica TaxID=434234 RepID=A0ACC1A3U5_9ROSI|nr:hypothetical protein Patl1_10069 [Pistacia atlantica]
MGFHQNQTLKCFSTSLMFLFFFLIFFSCSTSSSVDQIQPRISSSPSNTQYQVLYTKNTRPFLLNNNKEFNKNRKKRWEMMKRKHNAKNFNTRSFSAMLPKGFVPPSRSSPCHNENPDSSVTFYCDFSTRKP